MKKLEHVACFLGILLLAAGCRPPVAADGPGADIRGKIAGIVKAEEKARREGVLGFLMIEGTKEDDTKFDRARVKILEKTRILERAAGREERPRSFADLEAGQRVQVRFTGPVLESYPIQATAEEVVILR
jgi:hypothetical protein